MRKRHRSNYPARVRQSLKFQYDTFYRSRLSKGVAAREALLRRLDDAYAFFHLQNYVALLTGGYLPMGGWQKRTLRWLACEEQGLDVSREVAVYRTSHDRRRFMRHLARGKREAWWETLKNQSFRQDRYAGYGKTLSDRMLRCKI